MWGAEQMGDVVQGLLRQRRVALVRDSRLPQKSPVEEHGPMGCARGVHTSIDQQLGNAGDPSVVHGGNNAGNMLVVGCPRPDSTVQPGLPAEGLMQQIPQPVWIVRSCIQRINDLIRRRFLPVAQKLGLEGYCQLGAEEAKLPRAQPSREYTSAHEGNTSRIAPGEEGAITSSSVLTGREAMTAELEVVVDRSVSGEELLRMSG
jgi:hypothetical protein